jgi:hypothetical protein
VYILRYQEEWFNLKGPGSRDGLKLSFHAWVDLDLKMGRNRFLNFSDAPIPEEEKNYLFFAEKAKPMHIPLEYVFGVYSICSYNSFLRVNQCNMP